MSGEFAPPPPSVVAVQGPDAPEKLKRLVDPRDYQVHARGDIALAAGSQKHIHVEAGTDSVTVWLGRAIPEDATAAAAVLTRRTVSGVQPKLLAWRDGDLIRPATDESPAGIIAKYAPEARPDLLRNEIHSLSLAAEILGEGEVTRFASGALEGIPGYALLVERFDRAADGGKLRLEDFAQVLARPRGADFRGKYEGGYEEIAEAILRHSARPEIDRARFFSALVFTLVIGNADAHLKNWSLLERPEGLRLAPQYDLLNTLLYGGDYGRHAALAIGGEAVPIEAVDARLVLAFAERIGLPARAAGQRLEQLRRGFARSRRLIPPAAEPPDGFLNRYAAIVRAACARIFES